MRRAEGVRSHVVRLGVAAGYAQGVTARLEGRCLYRSESLCVMDYRCRALSPEKSGEEHNTRHAVVLPRAGVFVRHVRGEAVVGDSTQAMFFEAGEPYRVSHPVGCGDRCTSIGLTDAALAELLRDRDPAALDRREGVFRHTHAPTNAATDLRHRRLVRDLARARRGCDSAEPALPTDLAIDEVVVSVLEAAFGAAYGISVNRGMRPATLRAHRDLTDRVRLVLAGRFRGRVVLGGVARAVHSSPFHLTRVFRLVAGMPMHRYLTRLRLRAALEELAEAGGPDLSRVALSLGFYDQSHLANAFRSELGITPSRWRREATRREVRRMSKILQD